MAVSVTAAVSIGFGAGIWTSAQTSAQTSAAAQVAGGYATSAFTVREAKLPHIDLPVPDRAVTAALPAAAAAIPTPPAPAPTHVVSAAPTPSTSAPRPAVRAAAVVHPTAVHATAALGYGCGPALAYLAAHAAPGFVFQCPGYSQGHQAMTCINTAGVCPGEHLIAIDIPCPAAYENEASNSWVLVGLRSAPIDPFGDCHH